VVHTHLSSHIHSGSHTHQIQIHYMGQKIKHMRSTLSLLLLIVLIASSFYPCPLIEENSMEIDLDWFEPLLDLHMHIWQQRKLSQNRPLYTRSSITTPAKNVGTCIPSLIYIYIYIYIYKYNSVKRLYASKKRHNSTNMERAACGERVCETVYITVRWVYIKNKKQKM
jgi:hypothetical protein